MTKVTAKKTAGVLGDDLAMNGGAYLCFEGFEKLAHKFFSHATEEHAQHEKIIEAFIAPNIDLVALEREKMKGAIRTDFVLSAEIIVIALGTVKDAAFSSQVAVVSAIAMIMTIGVYGLVAGIVKPDDGGLALVKSTSKSSWGNFKRWFGNAILWFAPVLMKILSVVGTAAMFLVGGSIVLHGIPYSHHIFHYVDTLVLKIPIIGNVFSTVMPLLINGFAGILVGCNSTNCHQYSKSL